MTSLYGDISKQINLYHNDILLDGSQNALQNDSLKTQKSIVIHRGYYESFSFALKNAYRELCTANYY